MQSWPVPPWRICWPVSAGYKEKEMCRLRKCLLLLDGGTTNTRFTLVENNQILAQSQCRTGAVDAAREGQNHLLQAAVRREMNALQNRWDCSIEEIYAAGRSLQIPACAKSNTSKHRWTYLGWPQVCRYVPSRRSQMFRFALCRASGSKLAARITLICCAVKKRRSLEHLTLKMTENSCLSISALTTKLSTWRMAASHRRLRP